MFTPHITVACIVQAEERLLVVEERVAGEITWNQPAGHLEANESLLCAMQRELWEETGLQYPPQYLLGVHQWTAPDGTPFIRFLFGLDIERCFPTEPQDDDIDCCHWLTAEQILSSTQLRSPLVAESVKLWQTSPRYPLSLLNWFSAENNSL